MELRAITWNIFHGRDSPPNPALFSWRSKLLGTTEQDDTHVQVNRDLFEEFSGWLAAAEWDVALLQECPSRWSRTLAPACDAVAHISPTSRNWLGGLRQPLARERPDLLGSWEGGSNQILVRSTFGGGIREGRDLVLRRRPERRTMAFVRLDQGLCAVTLHASQIPRLAEDELRRAAESAVSWAGDAPLVFGGDFNLRPARTAIFEELEQRFELRAPTAPTAIDHLLVRDLEIVEVPRALPPELREVALDGRALRLSDHAPVTGRFQIRSPVD